MMNTIVNTHRSGTLRHTSGMIKRLQSALVAISVMACASASASSLDSVESLNQSQFLELTKNLGAATHYKSISPSEPLGALGFDIGLRVSSTEMDNSLFDLASDGDFDTDEIIVPSVSIHKGLLLGLDIGASLGAIPGTDATIVGAEVRYALVRGGVAAPAIGLRASYSQVNGVDDFSLNNTALELGISKGFFFLTPYAGVGIVSTSADPEDIDGLSSERDNQRKVFVGATINLGLAVTLEAERTGDFRTYTAKAGIRF